MNNRLDVELIERGIVESRERAKALIMSGVVYVNNQKALKAGDKVKSDFIIEIRGQKNPYVSRGGFKIEKAINVFNLELHKKICMDVGASTGGFTDCMLQNSALKVYAIDVGYGQLAWKLRNDDRVVNMERTNIRYLDCEKITDDIDFVSIDVAFISLKLVLPVVYDILRDGGEVLALIKPQFEAGRSDVGKKGVVRDILVHQKVINEVISFSYDIGFSVMRLDFSPIKGPEGNIEFLLLLKKDSNLSNFISNDDVIKVTNEAHNLEVKLDE